GMLASQQNQS
nr:Chain K, segA long small [Homo sapiens]6N3A_L Chain L, segA long small [Homo sapiens]6N3A_M Chain M, segA long small [Homo sapiens]6N3A_N Chain N, segA long small [Homo sapiens]6N3A_O Chain O, segA long small [Homo sapiens]6N3A_P Chain P, segA long small [Homo sapiens]6N3A_Q Chain Q, segA long small [Homo sapiens]6N3A_R Chain R, segA long small [Homo sapiens]6N3A_S Chain S, segA long small [Homo sapiens]6N3A_T Chain T, segA long small [Homo sapiens]